MIVLGLIAWPALRLRRFAVDERAARAHTFLLVPAVGQFLLLSLVAMAGIRYILLPIMLLVIAGSLVAVRLSRRLVVPSRQALAAAAAIADVASVLGTAAVDTADNPRFPSGELRDEYLSAAEPGPMAVVDDRVSGGPAYEVYRIGPGG